MTLLKPPTNGPSFSSSSSATSSSSSPSLFSPQQLLFSLSHRSTLQSLCPFPTPSLLYRKFSSACSLLSSGCLC
uniref:Uncharacterized protein n=1 Tax=Lotus japonicus TaxID=34305 RepID=I3SJC0_LOTJA|nr:unknown [Lotus japonicus]